MKHSFFIALLLVTFLAHCQNSESKPNDSINSKSMKFNKLTLEEEAVILKKATERPYSGKYYKFDQKGTYHCKQCGAALYKSDSKFDAHCGWPSFDDEIAGAVARKTDADGSRTEILCANCGGHLGHVFEGERFTDKNTRHCVNSVSLTFTPADMPAQTDTAIFASGCFWGTEYWFKKQNGVISTTVGYIGGRTDKPTYEQVCNKTTGHAEAVQVVYNPTVIDFETLAKLYFETHDPTQLNRQGPDIGDQYRSEIFYTSETQKTVAEKLIKELETKGLKVVTRVTKATEFFRAEEYHQDYYEKVGKKPYCHVYTKRF